MGSRQANPHPPRIATLAHSLTPVHKDKILDSAPGHLVTPGSQHDVLELSTSSCCAPHMPTPTRCDIKSSKSRRNPNGLFVLVCLHSHGRRGSELLEYLVIIRYVSEGCGPISCLSFASQHLRASGSFAYVTYVTSMAVGYGFD